MKENQQYSAILQTLTREERSLLLKKKLEELHNRLNEIARRKLYDSIETLQILKTNKEPYRFLDPDSEESKQENKWFRTHFPAWTCRLKWEEIPRSICYKFEDTIEAAHIIKEFCKDFPANDQITIFWNNGSLPIFIMDLEIALKYAHSLIEDQYSSEIWFFNKARKWCIEVLYFKEEVTIGYSPVQD